jgi:hypothetical protein
MTSIGEALVSQLVSRLQHHCVTTAHERMGKINSKVQEP